MTKRESLSGPLVFDQRNCRRHRQTEINQNDGSLLEDVLVVRLYGFPDWYGKGKNLWEINEERC